MLRDILHRSVRVVPTRMGAKYIPTGKPVELRAQKLAAKRLPSLSRKLLQKRSISNLHNIILLFFYIIYSYYF